MYKSLVTLAASLLFASSLLASGSAFAHGKHPSASLSGAQEVPAVDTPASAKARVKFDKGYTRVEVDIEIRDLVGSFTRAHFHCARPSMNGPVVLGLIEPGPLTFDGKRIRGTLTNDDFSGLDCGPTTGRPIENVAALAFAIRDGLIYLNVHTDAFPGGEVRGQVE